MRIISLILLISLATISFSANAGWVGIGRAKDGVGKFYADQSSIQRTGNKVSIWALTDFTKVQVALGKSTPYRSYKLRLEFDCNHDETRNLGFIVFSGNMGKGEIVISDDKPLEWKPIAKGSILAVFANYACKQK